MTGGIGLPEYLRVCAKKWETRPAQSAGSPCLPLPPRQRSVKAITEAIAVSDRLFLEVNALCTPHRNSALQDAILSHKQTCTVQGLRNDLLALTRRQHDSQFSRRRTGRETNLRGGKGKRAASERRLPRIIGDYRGSLLGFDLRSGIMELLTLQTSRRQRTDCPSKRDGHAC